MTDAGDPPRVVVGVSDTPAARAALATAVDEARRRGAQLVAVRAWGPVPETTPHDVALPVMEDELADRADDAIGRAFAEVCGGVPDDIAVVRRTAEGTAGRELVRVADRPDDLLVVGRERHLALHRMLRGSAAGYCVDHAVCRVLVVPAPDGRTDSADGPGGVFY